MTTYYHQLRVGATVYGIINSCNHQIPDRLLPLRVEAVRWKFQSNDTPDLEVRLSDTVDIPGGNNIVRLYTLADLKGNSIYASENEARWGIPIERLDTEFFIPLLKVNFSLKQRSDVSCYYTDVYEADPDTGTVKQRRTPCFTIDTSIDSLHVTPPLFNSEYDAREWLKAVTPASTYTVTPKPFTVVAKSQEEAEQTAAELVDDCEYTVEKSGSNE